MVFIDYVVAALFFGTLFGCVGMFLWGLYITFKR